MTLCGPFQPHHISMSLCSTLVKTPGRWLLTRMISHFLATPRPLGPCHTACAVSVQHWSAFLRRNRSGFTGIPVLTLSRSVNSLKKCLNKQRYINIETLYHIQCALLSCSSNVTQVAQQPVFKGLLTQRGSALQCIYLTVSNFKGSFFIFMCS